MPAELCSFQNWRVFSIERVTNIWRLNVKNRFKRRLFWCSIGKRLSKVSNIPVGEQSMQISVPLFRPLFSGKNIYKTHKSIHLSTEKTLHKNYNLLRRYTFNGGLKGWFFDSPGYTNIPTTESGISMFRNQYWIQRRLWNF